MMVQDFLMVKNLKKHTFTKYEKPTPQKNKKCAWGSRKIQPLFFLTISTHFSIFIKSGVWNSFFRNLNNNTNDRLEIKKYKKILKDIKTINKETKKLLKKRR